MGCLLGQTYVYRLITYHDNIVAIQENTLNLCDFCLVPLHLSTES